MRLTTAISWAIAAQYLTFVIQFAASLYLARHYISPTDLGTYTAAAAAAAIVTSFQDFGMTRFLVGLKNVHPEMLHAAFRLSLLLAIMACLLCALAAWPTEKLVGTSTAATIMIILGAGALFAPLSLCPMILLQRHMDFRAVAMVDTGSIIANAGITLTLAIAGKGAEALAWGSFAQQASRAFLAQYCIGGYWPLPFTSRRRKELIRYGQATTWMNGLWLIADRSPDLLIGHRLGLEAAGLFSRAQGLALVLRQLLSNATAGVFYSAFARERALGVPLAPLYERMTAAYCALTWPAFAGLALLAEPILALLFGDHWRAAAPALRWIAIAQICFVSLPLHIELPMLVGRSASALWRSVADSLLSLALVTFGIWHDLETTAAMRLAFGVIWLGIHGPQLFKIVELRWQRMSVIYAKSAGLALAGIFPAALYLLMMPGAQILGAQLFLLIMAGFLCWLAAIFIFHRPTIGVLSQYVSRAPSTR